MDEEGDVPEYGPDQDLKTYLVPTPSVTVVGETLKEAVEPASCHPVPDVEP